MDQQNFDRMNTSFSNNPALQELLVKNVVLKLWMHIDSKLDMDDLIYKIISDLEFANCLQHSDDDTDDFDKLRDMVLHRIGYGEHYE